MDLAFKTPVYADLYKNAGISRRDIKDITDLHKLPTVSKEDIVVNFNRAVACPQNQIIKYHTTSGSSGTPTTVAFTRNDWEVYVKQNIDCLRRIGVNSDDIVYNATPYGMFFAGMVLHDAAIAAGTTVIPAGIMSSTHSHFSLIDRFKPTVFIGVPHFLLKLGKDLMRMGGDPRESSLKKAYCLGEPLPDKKRDLIEDIWDIEAYRGYGLSECGAGSECRERLGFHWPIDDIYTEVLDPGDDGRGELTYTTLTKTGTIAVRFRSRDRGNLIDERCPCGDKNPLISYIEERLDDLVKVKGTLISPYAVDDAMYSFKSTNNYLFVIEEIDDLDAVKLYIESSGTINKIDIKKAISSATFVTPTSIILVPNEEIPVIGRKGKRFVDLRKENPYNETIRKFERSVQAEK